MATNAIQEQIKKVKQDKQVPDTVTQDSDTNGMEVMNITSSVKMGQEKILPLGAPSPEEAEKLEELLKRFVRHFSANKHLTRIKNIK
jgi:hypothetical protein